MNRKILLCGGCDISAIKSYLRGKRLFSFTFDETGSYENCISSHWLHTLYQQELQNNEKYNIVYPNSSFFNDYNVVVLSILNDIGLGLYKRKTDNFYLRFGFPNINAITNKSFYLKCGDFQNIEHVLDLLYNEYEYLGDISSEDIVDNYKHIIEKFNSKTKIYIILGPTFYSGFGEFNTYFNSVDGVKIYQKLNKEMIDNFGSYNNVIFIDPSRYYKKPKKRREFFYYNHLSIRHYPRKVYKKIAKYLFKHNLRLLSFCYFHDFFRLLKRIFK